MLISNFLTSRKSDRHFKNKKINKDSLSRLEQVFNLMDNESVSFKLYENGKDVFEALDGHAGYNGVMIEAPAYITVTFKGDSNKDKVVGMYKAEDVISLLEKEGLGSCWIGLFNTSESVKEKAFQNKHANLILAVGYPKPKNPFVQEEKSERLPVEDIVFNEEIGNPISIDELEQLGLDDVFYYARFAPSTLNSQSWRFVIRQNQVVLYLKEVNGKLYYEDMGIIMYYFEQMYNMTFHKGEWKLEDNFVMHDGYVKIATMNI